MLPRSPPKISLRQEWTKELDSKVVQHLEGETIRQPGQTKFFQSTQPTPNPIRDRSERPDDMQDERKTSRSQDINVNSFNEELSSSDRTGRPVETEEFKHVHLKIARVSMLTRFMIEQGDLLLTQLQYKTIFMHTMKPTRSTPTMRQFVKELRKTWTSKFQDYHILFWSKRTVPAFEN